MGGSVIPPVPLCANAMGLLAVAPGVMVRALQAPARTFLCVSE